MKNKVTDTNKQIASLRSQQKIRGTIGLLTRVNRIGRLTRLNRIGKLTRKEDGSKVTH